MNEEEINEEEVRGKILLPFLQDLGFDLSEISLEDGFTIRLGRSKPKLGRSDILIKRNGINLFVSNGITIRIFDSITREELTNNKISERDL